MHIATSCVCVCDTPNRYIQDLHLVSAKNIHKKCKTTTQFPRQIPGGVFPTKIHMRIQKIALHAWHGLRKRVRLRKQHSDPFLILVSRRERECVCMCVSA
jgi:hypothetical protein